jgi:hypothetical protein
MNCVDEGTIQAFLDGELTPDVMEGVAVHVASCTDCGLLLETAESESEFAFSLLAEEFDAVVPTERLRARVFSAIETVEQPKPGFWQRFSGLRLLLSSPSFAAAAGLLIIAGIAAFILNSQNESSGELVAKSRSTGVKAASLNLPNVDAPQTEIASEPINAVRNVQKQVVAERRTNRSSRPVGNKKPAELWEGEGTFLKTIATLESNVNEKKNSVLKASSRISFERDMAVVENSINRLQAEVRKNPKNDAAKQMLRISYQNKIDLLDSVTERREFMAALD